MSVAWGHWGIPALGKLLKSTLSTQHPLNQKREGLFCWQNRRRMSRCPRKSWMTSTIPNISQFPASPKCWMLLGGWWKKKRNPKQSACSTRPNSKSTNFSKAFREATTSSDTGFLSWKGPFCFFQSTQYSTKEHSKKLWTKKSPFHLSGGSIWLFW